MPPCFIRFACCVLLGVSWFVGPASLPVRAAPAAYIVTNTQDNAADANCAPASCTLRQAVNASNANDPGAGNRNAITFKSGVTGAISLQAGAGFGTLALGNGVSIVGPGPGALTISGGGAVRVFAIDTNINARYDFQHLTIANGAAPDRGAGVNAVGGQLGVSDCVFLGNVTNSGGSGGAISASFGSVDVRDSLFLLNSAGTGGGIYSSLAQVHVVNSTFARNSAARGAAVALVSRENLGGEMAVRASTLTANTANAGGGAVASLSRLDYLVELAGSIVSGNAGGDIADDLYDDSGGNIIGGAPLLDPLLQNNLPGTTPTFALLPGSPAIDRGPCAVDPITGETIHADQRGVPRPQGAACDAGAYESRGFAFTGSSGALQSAGVGADYANPLAVTVVSAVGEAVEGGLVTFTAPPTGPSATFGARPGCAVTQASRVAACAIAGGVATSPPLTATGAAGQFEIVATASGVPSALGFLLGNRPIISGIAPGSGEIASGATATITGAGFGTDRNRVRVVFDGITDAAVVDVTDTTITLRTPPHAAGNVAVSVAVGGVGGASVATYTYGVVAPLPGAKASAPLSGSPDAIPVARTTGHRPASDPNPLPPPRP